MRIAMVGQKIIPFTGEGGGIERHVEELSVRLVKQGHEVLVYSRSRLNAQKPRSYQGVRIVYLPSIPTKNFDTITHVFLATLHALFQKVDVIHYHGVGPSTLAWIPRVFKPRAKVVVTFHSIDRFHKKWGWLARWYLGWGEWTACHFPHVTIAVSRAIADYCQHRFKRNTVYIPNGVNFNREAATHDYKIRRFDLRRGEYILTVARLVKHKGIHYLIEAYKKLIRVYGTDGANWPGGVIRKLVITGAPSYSDDYVQYLRKIAEGTPHVVFTGMQTGETLAQLFADAYLYVHPSEAEGLSTTILEAMSYGTCVLVSDIPENLESIDHAGFVFKSQSADDLFEMLEYLLDFPEGVKRHAARAVHFIKQNFDWDDIAKQVERVYTNK